MTSDAQHAGKLSFDECWELLEGDTLGRLGLVADGHPEIFPVNYVVHRRSIVFRTSGVTKLWNAKEERPARALTGRRFKVATPDIWNTRLTDRRRTSFE